MLTSGEDAANANFAPDTVSGFAVNAIALQVPITWLTSTGLVESKTSTAATIGIWGTTSRARLTIRRSPLPDRNFPNTLNPIVAGRLFRQVQRLGNPLINELIIGIGSKDYWSMSQPVDDSQFASFDLDPPFVSIVDALYAVLVPGALNSPPAPRTDLLPLVTYAPPICGSCTSANARRRLPLRGRRRVLLPTFCVSTPALRRPRREARVAWDCWQPTALGFPTDGVSPMTSSISLCAWRWAESLLAASAARATLRRAMYSPTTSWVMA